MKANEFVKEHGWDFAKLFANGWITLNSDCDNGVSRTEVERLVKSYELVQGYGGLRLATNFRWSEKFKSLKHDSQSQLDKALKDVESCL